MSGPDPNNPKVVTIGAEIYYFNDLDTRKNEMFSELKTKKCHDLEDMVYRKGLKYRYIRPKIYSHKKQAIP